MHTQLMQIKTSSFLFLSSLIQALDQARVNQSYNPLEILQNSQNKKIIFEETSDKADKDNENEFPLRNAASAKRQTILLSATLSQGVTELAEFVMKDHVFVEALEIPTSSAVYADALVIPDTVKQEFLLTYVKHRLFTLSALIVAKAETNTKMFVFMASTQMVEFHYQLFTKCLLKMPVNRGKPKLGNAAAFQTNSDDDDDEDEEEIVLDTEIFMLHGNMDQKLRKGVFTAFRAAKRGVLLCTVRTKTLFSSIHH